MKLFIGKIGILLGEGKIGIAKECEDGKYRGRAMGLSVKSHHFH